MNHHYVLAPHDPALAERASALVAAHQASHGVRAVATASKPSDFGHVIALQAADDSALRALLGELALPPQRQTLMASTASAPVVLSVCGDVPCEQLNRKFDIVPSGLPLCHEIVFLLMELDGDVHDIVDDIHVPDVQSHLAGVAIADGRTLLVELGNDDPAQLERDVAQLKAVAHVRSVRMVHAAGREQVRSPHI